MFSTDNQAPIPAKQPHESMGILLTGGNSRRFGSNKLLNKIGDDEIAQLAAATLTAACDQSFEAGIGLTSLPQIPDLYNEGPLRAISVAAIFLRENGFLDPSQSALILAGDMPLMQTATLKMLINWPGDKSVVPVIHDQPQYLAARWSSRSLHKAVELVQLGVRKVRLALEDDATLWVNYDVWENEHSYQFLDVDTKDDFELALKTYEDLLYRGPLNR